MQQSTQNDDVLTLGGAIARLAPAPLVGALLLAGWIRPPRRPGLLLVDVILVSYVTVFCAAATLVFVIPIMAAWPPARRPGYVVAAVWGTLSAWCSVAIITGFRELVRWEPMLGFGLVGCVCGLFYARLARPLTGS
jgi:uncharacterized membrane protein YraQ (UPF0718 family)